MGSLVNTPLAQCQLCAAHNGLLCKHFLKTHEICAQAGLSPGVKLFFVCSILRLMQSEPCIIIPWENPAMPA